MTMIVCVSSNFVLKCKFQPKFTSPRLVFPSTVFPTRIQVEKTHNTVVCGVSELFHTTTQVKKHKWSTSGVIGMSRRHRPDGLRRGTTKERRSEGQTTHFMILIQVWHWPFVALLRVWLWPFVALLPHRTLVTRPREKSLVDSTGKRVFRFSNVTGECRSFNPLLNSQSVCVCVCVCCVCEMCVGGWGGVN